MATSMDQRKGTKDLEWDYDSAGRTDATPELDSPTEPPSYDRREMRRRLSLDSDHEEEIGSQISARIRRSILRERLNQRQNLQICFMQTGEKEDLMSEDEEEEDENHYQHHDEAERKQSIHVSGYSAVSQENHKPMTVAAVATAGSKQQANQENVVVKNPSNILSQLFGSFSSKNTASECIRRSFSSFDEYHKHIHTEAKKALKSAKEMAKMQMQLEKQQTKASKVLGIEAAVCEQPIQYSLSRLRSMTCMQMRMLITRIVNRTEELNVSLVRMLEERDDLHMEQDSLLVDIQDMTQFLNTKNQW